MRIGNQNKEVENLLTHNCQKYNVRGSKQHTATLTRQTLAQHTMRVPFSGATYLKMQQESTESNFVVGRSVPLLAVGVLLTCSVLDHGAL